VKPYRHVLESLVVAIAVATVGATIVGFWLSYGGLHDFAVLGGMRKEQAWAWPASVDLFTLAGELGVTISAVTKKPDGLSWFLGIAGFAPSMIFNVSHVDPRAAHWAHYAVAAVPPAAAMLALAAMLRQVHRLVTAMQPASGNVVSSPPPSDNETAARASLAATVAVGNPLNINQLQTKFSLTRAVATRLHGELVPKPVEKAALNGSSPDA